MIIIKILTINICLYNLSTNICLNPIWEIPGLWHLILNLDFHELSNVGVYGYLKYRVKWKYGWNGKGVPVSLR